MHFAILRRFGGPLFGARGGDTSLNLFRRGRGFGAGGGDTTLTLLLSGLEQGLDLVIGFVAMPLTNFNQSCLSLREPDGLKFPTLGAHQKVAQVFEPVRGVESPRQGGGNFPFTRVLQDSGSTKVILFISRSARLWRCLRRSGALLTLET